MMMMMITTPFETLLSAPEFSALAGSGKRKTIRRTGADDLSVAKNSVMVSGYQSVHKTNIYTDFI